MKDFLKSKSFLIIILVILGLVSRLIFLNRPDSLVFDEVHFGKFVSAYFTGEYYFDIHPPLGKLLIALGAKLGGYSDYLNNFGVFDFASIGEKFPQELNYVSFRIMPAIFGGLIPLVVFLFLDALKLPRKFAFFAGLTLVFENALIVQSHNILMDSFLIFFGFLGLWLFLKAREKNYNKLLLLLMSFSLTFSFSIKWTGLSFWGLAGLITLYDLFKTSSLINNKFQLKKFWIFFKNLFTSKETAKIILSIVVYFIILPFIIYFLIFVIHFWLLPNQGSGTAFMSEEFNNNKLNIFEKFLELNIRMYTSNSTIEASHPYGSPFYSWPLMLKPIYYWVDNNSETPSRIYLLGNPIIWYSALIGLIGSLFLRNLTNQEKFQRNVLLIGYFANLLPFYEVSRVLFLYHYFTAFIFSVCLLWFSLAHLKVNNRIVLAFFALIIISFIFFSPLTYGLPLSPSQYDLRVWLKTWI